MKEYRVSYKREGVYNHLRHRIFKKEETARKWLKFFSGQTKDKRKGLWINPVEDDWYYEYPITPIIFGPRLQVREVGEWEDV